MAAPTKGILVQPPSLFADYDRFMDFTVQGLPNKFTQLRPHQRVSIQKILAEYDNGADLVIFDAPTGTGKTVIAEIVRHYMKGRGTYVCSDKALQRQFVTDFHYAKLLQGKSNYPTLNGGYMVTCEDCNWQKGMGCAWCNDRDECPYQIAKREAIREPLAVINTSYMLAEMNGPGKMSGRTFGIVDECDTLEDILMGYVEFRLSEDRARELGVTVPVKGAHKPTIQKWLDEDLRNAIDNSLKKLKPKFDDVKGQRRLRSLLRLYNQVINLKIDDGWVRDYEKVRRGGKWVERNSMILKPIMVNDYGGMNVWRHHDKWLIMSATVVSPEEMIKSLGMDQTWNLYDEDGKLEEHGPLNVGVVTAPMTFPVENRPVYYSPVAGMSRKDEKEGLPKMLGAIEYLCRYWRADEFPEGVRTLIHAHKYDLATNIVDHLRTYMPNRKVITYLTAKEKDKALEEYKRHPSSILVAVSMGRGVDLPDDLCRLQILAKVPFPYLGDAQINARMRSGADGQVWYSTHTARTILQACGRGVRHDKDWCDMWILDRSFSTFKAENKDLLPDWWLDGLEFIREMDFQRYVLEGC